jgi:4-aminobutyrate aminotransferase-like enzyme
MFAGLQALKDRFDIIGDVRGGHGLMNAVELVGDRSTKSAPDKAVAGRIQAAAYQAGAMVRVSGPNIILSPPLIISAGEVDVILSALETGLRAV